MVERVHAMRPRRRRNSLRREKGSVSRPFSLVMEGERRYHRRARLEPAACSIRSERDIGEVWSNALERLAHVAGRDGSLLGGENELARACVRSLDGSDLLGERPK